jgi:hypothetical protein
MINFGLKYHNHNENHCAKDTLYSVDKEVIKNGRCLKHQDIIITRCWGLFTKECNRCADDYKLSVEIERIKNLIKDSINVDIIELQTNNIQTKMETTAMDAVDEEPIKTFDEESKPIIDEESKPIIDEEPKQIINEEPKQTINEEPKQTINEEPIKTFEDPKQTINKRIDNGFNKERIQQIKKNKCRCCNRQKNGRFDTCCQACINGTHTSDCNKRNEKIPSQDKFDNPNKSSSLKHKTVDEEPIKTIEQIKTIDEEPIKTIEQINSILLKTKNGCRDKSMSTPRSRKDTPLPLEQKSNRIDYDQLMKQRAKQHNQMLKQRLQQNIKYPFISKITDKSVTLNDITYTLCEVKVLEHSWIPTSKILTQMWIKYKHNGKKINPRFPGNMDTEIYDTETEYIVELDAIRSVYDNSFYRHNGAYIVSEYPGLVNPICKVVNGEIVQIPRHISDILPTFPTRKWYNFSYLNSKQILEWFKWPHNEYR